MDELTLDMNQLMTRWMKLYVNLNVVMSKDPMVREILAEMKMKIAELNEYLMGFFDLMGAEPILPEEAEEKRPEPPPLGNPIRPIQGYKERMASERAAARGFRREPEVEG